MSKRLRNSKTSIYANVSWNAVLNVLILLLAFYVFLPQLDQFSTSLDTLSGSSTGLVAIAFILGMSTLLFASLTYCLLAGPQLRYFRTLSVQIASTFTNRLLPAGIGGLSLNIRYLVKSGFPAGKAGSIAAANNLLGFFGHMILVLVALLLGNLSLGEMLDIKISLKLVLLALATVLLIGSAAWLLKKPRHKVVKAVKEAATHLAAYRKKPTVLVLSLLSSLVLTMLYVTCFFVSSAAVGLDLSAAEALIVFSLGVAAGTITPTPGGLVGVEAGMLAGLIGFGFDEASSLSAVLLYRLVTYWIPILPGLIVFKLLQYRRVI
jgi:uncharacterized protein (TIRG00374 family)